MKILSLKSVILWTRELMSGAPPPFPAGVEQCWGWRAEERLCPVSAVVEESPATVSVALVDCSLF